MANVAEGIDNVDVIVLDRGADDVLVGVGLLAGPELGEVEVGGASGPGQAKGLEDVEEGVRLEALALAEELGSNTTVILVLQDAVAAVDHGGQHRENLPVCNGSGGRVP